MKRAAAVALPQKFPLDTFTFFHVHAILGVLKWLYAAQNLYAGLWIFKKVIELEQFLERQEKGNDYRSYDDATQTVTMVF